MKKEKKYKPEEYELNLKIVGQWDNLEHTSRPTRANNLVKISVWQGISPKKHLWIQFKGYKTAFITDSDMIIQLADILKAIKRNPELLKKDPLQKLIKW